MEEEQFVTDRIGTGLKVDLKITGCKNATEKDITLNIQKKPAYILIIKRDKQK